MLTLDLKVDMVRTSDSSKDTLANSSSKEDFLSLLSKIAFSVEDKDIKLELKNTALSATQWTWEIKEDLIKEDSSKGESIKDSNKEALTKEDSSNKDLTKDSRIKGLTKEDSSKEDSIKDSSKEVFKEGSPSLLSKIAFSAEDRDTKLEPKNTALSATQWTWEIKGITKDYLDRTSEPTKSDLDKDQFFPTNKEDCKDWKADFASHVDKKDSFLALT